MKKIYVIRLKKLLAKGELMHTSIFFFTHDVFKNPLFILVESQDSVVDVFFIPANLWS